jgi:hypothetical protein
MFLLQHGKHIGEKAEKPALVSNVGDKLPGQILSMHNRILLKAPDIMNIAQTEGS